eukprot:1159614-Pelagomonas_calceolata.AAC.2
MIVPETNGQALSGMLMLALLLPKASTIVGPTPCPPRTQAPTVSCTDDGSKRRVLLASSADTSFNVALSDDLTQDEFNDFQAVVRGRSAECTANARVMLTVVRCWAHTMPQTT